MSETNESGAQEGGKSNMEEWEFMNWRLLVGRKRMMVWCSRNRSVKCEIHSGVTMTKSREALSPFLRLLPTPPPTHQIPISPHTISHSINNNTSDYQCIVYCTYPQTAHS